MNGTKKEVLQHKENMHKTEMYSSEPSYKISIDYENIRNQ